MADDKNDRERFDDALRSDDEPPAPISETDRDDVMAAIRELFLDGQARPRDEAIRDVARALRFRRVGSTINEILGNDVRTAVRRGILDNTSGEFRLLCRTIDRYTRDHLIDILPGALGQGWSDRGEATIAAARHIGFRRTGTNIRAAFKSAINGPSAAACSRQAVQREFAASDDSELKFGQVNCASGGGIVAREWEFNRSTGRCGRG